MRRHEKNRTKVRPAAYAASSGFSVRQEIRKGLGKKGITTLKQSEMYLEIIVHKCK